MKRMIIYPLVFLVLIGMEGLLTMGEALKYENYGVVGWIAQVLAIILCAGISEAINKNEEEIRGVK